MEKKKPKLFIMIIYVLLTISILYFTFIPIVNVIINGLFFESLAQDYLRIFGKILEGLRNSFIISIPVTIIATTFGIIASITLWRVKFFGRRFIRLLVLFPLINPPFVGSVAFIMLFGKRGLITHKLLNLSISPFGAHGVIIMQSLGLSTLAYLIISSSVKKINLNYENASRNLGASELKTFFSVTLPTMKPEITVAAMLVFLGSMSDFETPLIIGGQFRPLASELYVQITGRFDMNMATIMGVFLFIPCFAAFIIQKYFSRKNVYYMQWHEGENIEYRKMTNTARILLVGSTSLFAFFVAIKYGFIVIGAFTENWGHNYSFTLRHIQSIVGTNLTPFYNSLKLAFGVSILSSFLGVLLAYILKFRKVPFGEKVDFIASLPAAVPGILLGIAYLVTFKYPLFGIGHWIFPGIEQRPFILLGTGIIVYIICIYRYFYVGLKSGYAFIENMDPNLESASNNLGAGDDRTFIQVIFPILRPAFGMAFVRNFTSTMTTLGAIIFLLLPTNRVAVQQVFQVLRSSTIGAGAAMGLLLSFISLASLLTFQLFLNHKKIHQWLKEAIK
ncbi:MAG: iron ABC transporter permease [Alkaliphilus sp.]|nr:iron ABC transporter permease [Alkaliphilus sp.]